MSSSSSSSFNVRSSLLNKLSILSEYEFTSQNIFANCNIPMRFHKWKSTGVRMKNWIFSEIDARLVCILLRNRISIDDVIKIRWIVSMLWTMTRFIIFFVFVTCSPPSRCAHNKHNQINSTIPNNMFYYSFFFSRESALSFCLVRSKTTNL